MASYHPLLPAETPGLRTETEAFLCAAPGAVEARIAERDAGLRERGIEVSFGTETETQFLDDPETTAAFFHASIWNLYRHVIDTVEGHRVEPGDPKHRKGQVVDPLSVRGRMLVNYDMEHPWNDDREQAEHDIIETKTAPADAREALERYWRTVGALGRTAGSYGKMAMLLSSQISACIITGRDGDRPDFVNFGTEPGGRYLAAVQAYLNAVYYLQLHAGLERGTEVQEAFPQRKESTTAVFAERLELRNPMTGIIDPRLGMLAVLEGVWAETTGDLPRELPALRPGYLFETQTQWPINALGDIAILDEGTDRLVVPAVLGGGRSARGIRNLNALVEELTGGDVTDYTALGGLVLRTLVSAIRLRDDDETDPSADPMSATISIDDGMMWSKELRAALDGEKVRWAGKANRIAPVELADSPESYPARRTDAVRSPELRRMFGAALPRLTPADEAVRRRQAMFDAVFVATES